MDTTIRRLDESAEYEMVVSLGRVALDDGEDVSFALVTLDGLTRGVIEHGTDLDSVLDQAVQRVQYGDKSEVVDSLRAALDEFGFDRAVELLERLAEESC